MDTSAVTMTDAIVIAIILLSALWGLMRGFVHEVLGIAAWVGAGFATLYGLAYVRPYARELISIENVADAGAAIAIFLVSLILFSILSGAISSQVRGSMLGALDRTLGFVFGIARGAVVVCLVYLIVIWAVQPDLPAWIASAKTRPLVERGAEGLRGLMPANLKNTVEEKTKGAIDTGKDAYNTAKTLQTLTSPPPKADAPRDGSGYNDAERRDMNRLFQGQEKGKQ